MYSKIIGRNIQKYVKKINSGHQQQHFLYNNSSINDNILSFKFEIKKIPLHCNI